MRVGILTSGGDCPGLNAAIRAVTRRLIAKNDFEVIGILNGFKGLIEGNIEPLSLYSVSGILPKGGTILGTSRVNPFNEKGNVERMQKTMQRYELDALVVIGDGDALNVAHQLETSGIHSVCIPTTIDNDVAETDRTFGFDTAVTIATEAIDRLHSTADSHHRIMVVEVMGRQSGWIATMAGLAGGADYILIPEVEAPLDKISELLTRRHKRKKFSIVVVAEGARPEGMPESGPKGKKTDEFGHWIPRGVGEYIGQELEKRTEMETRVTILGHIQRGGTPTAYDRVLASRFGVKAADMVASGKFSTMTALKGSKIVEVPLENVVGKIKPVDPELYEIASVFFG
ncbi:MAG: 6-phosphofructokinase [Calditrichaeota bacterium]|nr:MAG: 6-phosphofructokinase [Calditrichota bacterium]